MTDSMHPANQRVRRFLQSLQEGFLIGDGAIGTQFYSRGVPLDANFEHLNLVNSQLVSQVHADYAAAGAQVLETNTFGANASRLSAIGLEKKVRAINLAGARLAREAAGEERYVAGSVGPLASPKGETEELSSTDKETILREQMSALAEGGVDFFLLETFADLDDLELGVRLASVIGLPVVAQMAFLEGGFTRCGISVEVAAKRLQAAGAAVVGANCGAGPKDILAILERFAACTDLPLSAFPNSGFPQYVDGRYIYLATPEYFARQGVQMVVSGASLVGGCCGTGPEHIRELTRCLHEAAPVRSQPRISVAVAEAAKPTIAAQRRTFLDAWGTRPIVTVELSPPRGMDCDKVIQRARQLAAAGVDAISLAENPLARIRMGNMALASKIQDDVGIEVVVHVTGRDRNLIGLHSELMGAHLLGLRNILAVTGDPASLGGETGATSVFDLNSIGILQLLSALNQGRTLMGMDLEGRAEFLAGAAFNPNLANMSGQLHKLEKKVAAGARFVQTQPVYDLKKLQEMLQRTAPLGIPLLIGIMPLVSERNAEFLHNEVPGISLPETVRRRMRGKSGEVGIKEGMAIACELIEAGSVTGGGFYLMPPFGKVELALELLGFIRSRSS